MDSLLLRQVAKSSYYTFFVNESKNRGYMVFSGYWEKAADIPDYLYDTEAMVKELKPGFNILVNATNYVGCSSEIIKLHISSQIIAKEHGMSKAAEVYSQNSSAKLFSESFSRVSGIYTQIFQNLYTAETWLDMSND